MHKQEQVLAVGWVQGNRILSQILNLFKVRGTALNPMPHAWIFVVQTTQKPNSAVSGKESRN